MVWNVHANQMMYVVLIKLLIGLKWRKMRPMLMNCLVNYNDEVTDLDTHSGLLLEDNTSGPPWDEFSRLYQYHPFVK